jgi:hypothetical protein
MSPNATFSCLRGVGTPRRAGSSFSMIGLTRHPRHLRHLRLPAVSALMAAVALLGLVQRTGETTGLGAATMPRSTPFGEVWIGTRTSAETLSRFDASTTAVFLGGPTSFALGGWGSAVPALAWASEAAFEVDLAAGRVPPDVRVVMYDPENWTATPEEERADPAAAMRAFGTLARMHGYMVVITPHPNLVTVQDAACTVREGETMDAAFLRCRIQGYAAEAADVVEVQAQYLEGDPVAYKRFVSAAARQARDANPGVLVLSGLSTNFATEPSVLLRAWRSVIGVVDGHYLNVPHGRRAEMAIAFLRLAASAT